MKSGPTRRRILAVAALLALVSSAGCQAASGQSSSDGPTASSAFWEHWGDGKAELNGYEITTPRYGSPRRGEVVLIYVTEPMDARTWIKDDRGDVPPEHRVNVLKLNHTLKFRTGIYPYSVMTSVFAPVDLRFAERFDPGKITFTAQEWCGHVWHKLVPAADGFTSEIRSYFGGEGDAVERVPLKPGTLYEDALWIQLRELDGPFHGGESWEGFLVPALWQTRRAHEPPRPVRARITRREAERGGVAVTRFIIEAGSARRIVDVEREAPRRILGWSGSDGEEARLLGTERLPYWKLNGPGDESYLERIGLGAGP